MDCGKGQPKEDNSKTDSVQPLVEPTIKAMEFQEVIRARMEDVRAKTEWKRQEVRKLLEESKLRSEEEPEVKLCGLPNEIWKIIISQIDTPQDVGSIWEAYPRFRDLSGPSQTHEYLLSQLVSIEKLPFLWDCKDNWHRRTRKLMLFRSISKAMRNAVDRHLDEFFLKTLHGNRHFRTIKFSTWFSDMETLNDCLARFRDGPEEARAKRFCNRSITISLCDVKKKRNPHGHLLKFKGKMASLLEIVGDQIWHASFNICHQDPPHAKTSIRECYLFLQQLVCLMPNLKWLELNFQSCLSQISPAISPDTLANNPFPRLPQLERIGLMHFDYFLPKFEVLTEVLRPNSQVKYLDMDEFLEGTETEELKSLFSMLDLDAMTYCNRGFMPYVGNTIPIDNLQLLEPLRTAKCFLKDLKISFKTQDGGILLESVFKFVNNFPSLENMSLSSFGSITYEDCQLSSLNLPNLISFKMKIRLLDGSIDLTKTENVVSLLSLRFLLESKKLKHLVWSFFCGTIYNWRKRSQKLRKKLERIMINHERHEEMINFRGGLRDLTYSNVWQVFPELEHVKTHVLPEEEDEVREFHRPKFQMLK